jgi:hypothetical protein
MKKTFYLAFLVLIGCGQQKSSELVVDDSVPQDSLIMAVTDSASAPVSISPDLGETFQVAINIDSSTLLAELVNNPFPTDLEVMKATLDSLGVPVVFESGENGGLSYDRAEITVNRSYGESICEADIRSGALPLNKGFIIGMTLDEFLVLTGIRSSSDEQRLRFVYAYSAQEHTYSMHFDFTSKTLVRFYYQKDPCVIYD